MNKIKEFRGHFGWTQSDLAQKLGSTQQTVARWETGKSEIPVTMLRDMAVMFGCSVDTLLGLKAANDTRPKRDYEVDADAPYGTAALDVGFEVLRYPIDEETAGYLQERLAGSIELTGNSGWIELPCLNNKLVFANLAAVQCLDLISDETEAMPGFLHEEVYRALSDRASEIGPKLKEQFENAIAEGIVAEDDLDTMTITFRDGRRKKILLDDNNSFAAFQLAQDLDDVPSNAFTILHSDDSYVRSLVNLSHVAVIEVPLARHQNHLSAE